MALEELHQLRVKELEAREGGLRHGYGNKRQLNVHGRGWRRLVVLLGVDCGVPNPQ